MITAIEKNLQKGIELVQDLTQEQYCDQSLPPYYSSIGKHMRHILDVFMCILENVESNSIDLTKRTRSPKVEVSKDEVILYVTKVIDKINNLNENDLKRDVYVTDDLGLGKQIYKTTLEGILAQAQSHTIHHYATIGYLLASQNIDWKDETFGYNPTTPIVGAN